MIMLINYNSSKLLSKKVNTLNMNLSNNTNIRALEIKKNSECLPKTSEEEIGTYLNSLPQSLTKCEGAPDLFSFFWLQKVGRTDIWSLIKKNDLSTFKNNKQINTKLIEKNSVEKRNNFLLHKNKSKISLGGGVEEKMLKYTNKITQNTNFTDIVIGYQNNTSYGDKSTISSSKNSIKLKALNIYIFKKNIRFFIILILCNLINTFQNL